MRFPVNTGVDLPGKHHAAVIDRRAVGNANAAQKAVDRVVSRAPLSVPFQGESIEIFPLRDTPALILRHGVNGIFAQDHVRQYDSPERTLDAAARNIGPAAAVPDKRVDLLQGMLTVQRVRRRYAPPAEWSRPNC